MPKGQMVVRSIRIPGELDELLQKDAENEGLSVNSIVLRILRRYAEWDRFGQKLHLASLPTEAMRAVFDAMDPSKVEKTAVQMGSQLFFETMSLWSGEINPETFIRFLELVSRYSGLFQIETKQDANRITLIVRHDLGKNFSAGWRAISPEMMKIVFGAAPLVQVSDTQVMIKFQLPYEKIVKHT